MQATRFPSHIVNQTVFLRKIRHFAKILFCCLYWIDTVRTTSYHYGKITQRRNVR